MSLPIICEKYAMLTIKTFGLNQVFFTSSQSFFFNSTFSLHDKVLKVFVIGFKHKKNFQIIRKTKIQTYCSGDSCLRCLTFCSVIVNKYTKNKYRIIVMARAAPIALKSLPLSVDSGIFIQ